MPLKFLGKTLFLLLTCVVTNALAASANTTPVDPSAAIVKQAIMEFMQQNKIPGVAVELYVNGTPHAYYFGYADKATKNPVTKNTIFEVGSLSKIFTSVLVAEEVNANKMHLTDTANTYLPSSMQLSNSLKSITLENLATHTSGLPFNTPGKITTKKELEKFFAGLNPSAPIGSQWSYSNIGIGLLGYALENATHENYNQLYRKNILAPLGMNLIGITVPQNLQENYAQGYDENGKPTTPGKIDLLPAAWAVKASAQDMQNFLSAAIGLPGTPPAIQQAMQITQTPYVKIPTAWQGLAWQIHPLTSQTSNDLLHEPENLNLGPLPATALSQNKQIFDGDALIDKTGATDGFRAYIAVIPNHKSGIVILTNHYVSNGAIVNVGRSILLKENG